MFSLLLAVIYLAFISMGLPDSLLGSAWPTMQVQLGVPVYYMGIVSMTIAGGTIVSSLLSNTLTKKFGAGLVTAFSVLTTAVALFGFSVSDSFFMLWVLAIPYGLGAGAIDAALNNYVALHYAARHMSWLHCFWGLGASISPYIMGYCLQTGFGWSGGYRAVSILQIILTAVLFLSLPLWKKAANERGDEDANVSNIKFSQVFHLKGVKYALVTFFCYCSLEGAAGLWSCSYLVSGRGISPEVAAKYGSLFYLGITVGRFLCGFFSDKIGDRNLVRFGILMMFVGIAAIWLPVETNIICMCGLAITGLGCAPVYPCLIHSTPRNFGAENSQAIVGVQMASAYTGSTFAPPIFGIIAGCISINLYPAYLLVFAVLMFVMTEKLNRSVSSQVTVK